MAAERGFLAIDASWHQRVVFGRAAAATIRQAWRPSSALVR
jgi:hypothetical protein